MTHNLLHQLEDEGVSVWLDGMTREQLASGELASLVARYGVAGVTTNPTLFATSLTAGPAYDDQLNGLGIRGVGAEEAARLLAAWDVRAACDVMEPYHVASGGRDGYVSLEVNPVLADDAAATMAEVRDLSWLVDRPNVMIKVPATDAGLTAIAQATAAGFNINATLIFSVDRYRAVLDAYRLGLQQALERGRDVRRIRSVASVFVSRIDAALAARRSDTASAHAGGPAVLAGVANARRIHDAFEAAMRSATWRELLDAGANPQRPLWASTGVKDDSLDPTTYVTALAVPGTVNTMPLATLHATGATPASAPGHEAAPRDHVAEAEALRALEIDHDDLMGELLDDGVRRFSQSWRDVVGLLAQRLETAARTTTSAAG